jgi:hypothetical protein
MKHYERLTKDPTLWPDHAIYFYTDSTFLHFPYFNDDNKKQIVLNQIIKLNKQLGIPITDYSIAVNHYHLKFYLKKGMELSKAVQLLRGGISYEYNKRYEKPYQDMWQTRHTIIIKSEDMNRKTSGYIIGNLLKHKEASTFDDLMNDNYSSFKYAAERLGRVEATELVRQVIDSVEDRDGMIDFEGLSHVSLTGRLKSAEPSAKAG